MAQPSTLNIRLSSSNQNERNGKWRISMPHSTCSSRKTIFVGLFIPRNNFWNSQIVHLGEICPQDLLRTSLITQLKLQRAIGLLWAINHFNIIILPKVKNPREAAEIFNTLGHSSMPKSLWYLYMWATFKVNTRHHTDGSLPTVVPGTLPAA